MHGESGQAHERRRVRLHHDVHGMWRRAGFAGAIRAGMHVWRTQSVVRVLQMLHSNQRTWRMRKVCMKPWVAERLDWFGIKALLYDFSPLATIQLLTIVQARLVINIEFNCATGALPISRRRRWCTCSVKRWTSFVVINSPASAAGPRTPYRFTCRSEALSKVAIGFQFKN